MAQRAAGVDLEALEVAIRQAVLVAGAKVLEELLRNVGVGRREAGVRCRCGEEMQSGGVREKRVQTLLGWLRFERSRYQCPRCGKVRCPGDEELDVVNTSRSPGVRRHVARLGAKEPFREAARDMAELAGVTLSRKDAERTGQEIEGWLTRQRQALRFQEPPPPETIETLYVEFDGTGVPMVPHEVQGRKGKQKDGSAKTREAKLGCVFTQTDFNEDGRPIRDPGSTTYTGAIEDADHFGWRIYAEAVRRGLFEAERVVVLTDGAQWIRKRVELHFPQAIHIIDLYHAKQHIHDLAKLLFDGRPDCIVHYRDRWWNLLEQGHVEQITDEVRKHLPREGPFRADALRQLGYLDTNKNRMRYEWFKAQGLFIGSGVVEAACKTIIGQRLKQSGMEWTVRGANAILALRCATLSRRTEDFWEQRAP